MTNEPNEPPSPYDRGFPPNEPVRGAPPRESEPTLAVARLLRGAGATLLLASAVTLLLQRWNHGDDLAKYGLLVAQTVVVVAAAFICGLRVRESRSARTFLALALATVPVHFTVLGAFVYSRFPMDTVHARLPSQATWVAPSDHAAVLTVLGALAVLVPIAYVSLLALVRTEARRLLGLVLALNALLLVPVRTPSIIGAGIALGVLLLSHLEAGWFSNSVAMGTPEGRIVRWLLATPVAMLAARAIWLYSPTLFFTGLCLIAVGTVLFTLAARIVSDRGARAVRHLGTALAATGSVTIAIDVTSAPRFPAWLALPVFGLPVAALLLVTSAHAGEDGATYRKLSRLVAFVTVVGNLLWHGTVGAAWLSLVVGLLLLAAGTYRKRLGDLVLGSVAAVIGLAVQVHLALGFERWFNWGSLSLLGVCLVVLAAFLERHPERLAPLLATWLGKRHAER